MGGLSFGDFEPSCAAPPKPGAHDELRRRAQRAGVPLNAVMQVTARCNFRCAHCYETHTDGAGELTLAEIDRILGELADLGVLYLGYTGGEFFMRPDADDLLRAARSHGFLVRLLTTGYHVNDKRADLLQDLGIFEVHISLYGHTPEIHEQVTLLPGSWERSVAAVDRLRSRGIHVVLKSPLMRVNADHVDEMIAFAAARGCEMRIDPKVTAREDGDHAPLLMRASDEQVSRYYAKYRVPAALRSGNRFEPSDPAASSSCGVARASLLINPTGLVFPCTSIPVACGDLRVQNVSDVWFRSSFLATMRGVTWDSIEPCRSCDVRRYCMRCHAQAMLEDGALLGKSSEACRHAVLLRDQLRAAGIVPESDRALPPASDASKVRTLDVVSVYGPSAPATAKRANGLKVLAA